MNLVKHTSSNTADRACLAYTRQSAFGRRQSLPIASYTSTMKQIMGCYHLHIERTQTVRKKLSVGNDRPLSLICLLRSSSFSEAGRPPGAPVRPHQRPWPRLCSSCRCSWSVTPLLSSCDDHTLLLRYALRFQSWIFSRTKGSTRRPPARRQPLLHPAAESSLHTGCTPSYRGTYQLLAAVSSASRAHTESPNMSAHGALTCTELTGVVCA